MTSPATRIVKGPEAGIPASSRIIHKGRIIPVVRGRKRRFGKRENNGQLQRASRSERREDIRGVVLAYRRKEVGNKDAPNPLVENIIGRLRLAHNADVSEAKQDPMSISPRQHDALERYVEAVRSFAWAHGIPLGVQSPPLEWQIPGERETREPTAEHKERITKRYNSLFVCLVDAGRQHHRARLVHTVNDICMGRVTMADLSSETVGDLRLGANAIGKALRDGS